MRILYFGDASWGAEALERLVNEGFEICGVVQRVHPTDGVLEQLAQQLKLPLYQPRNCNDDAFLQVIRELSPDLNLSVSYDQILRAPIIASAPRGFVNFHAGKLPWYRGRSVINWALINGEKEIGLTAHYVDEGIDTGDIILQRTLPVSWEDDYATVMAQMVAAFPGLVVDAVKILASGDFTPQPQSHLSGSYFPRRGPGDEWIDWTAPSRTIYNKIRGIAPPGPGARTLFEDQELIVSKASYDPAWPCYIATPGQIVGIDDNEIRVKTGDSTLVINEWSCISPAAQAPIKKLRIGDRFTAQVNPQVQMLLDRISALETRLKKA